jgi:hypothetical protein
LAERVQAAYDAGGEEGQRCIQELMADKVEVRHTPPASFDGVVDRSFLISYQNDGWAANKASMRDLRLDGKVTVEGDRLVVTKTFSGLKTDGTEVRAVSRAAYRVEHGRIVGAHSTGTVVEQTLRDAREA